MPIGEVFLGTVFAVLSQKLASLEWSKYTHLVNIHKQLHNCSKLLLTFQAVLNDAEEKQITQNVVKLWLNDLQDLADDLENVVEELAAEALKRGSTAESQASSTSKLRKLIIPTCCTSFTPSAYMFNPNMDSKIRDITARLEELAYQKNILNLTEHVGRRRPNNNGTEEERLPTTSLVVESRVYGREADKVAILELLLRDEPCGDENEVCVIPIVGMGGIGKTTLAQLVYNDEKVKHCFDLKAWVCVSDKFDVIRITKDIFQSMTRRNSDSMNLNMLQEDLRKELSKKKFVLVLDDVWNENYGEWDLLSRPFQVGGLAGSKIIVTTRNQKVASTMMSRSVQAYNLKVLKYHDCLSLLAQHALGTRDFNAHLDLKAVGEDIAQRCNGLPLAAKALGGLLRTKSSVREWEEVLNSKIWDLPECDILPALRLSYYHLPTRLKNLFAHCAIFPKDYKFDRDHLILLWVGEVLLLAPEEEKQRMEDLGYKCFDDLLSRSFFQPSSGKSSKLFVMHDLMHDLAQSIAGERCYRLEGDEGNKISDRARHFSYIPQEYEVKQRFIFAAFSKVHHRLRTFLPVSTDFIPEFHLSNRVLHDVLPKLPCLRVLSLAHYEITELPDSIGDLKHLRYLNLSYTGIKCVPESVSTLYNLQTLLLRGCRSLYKLPSTLGNLINLRHLDNVNTREVQAMPLGIGKLTSLQTLTTFVVSKCGSGSGLRELRDLSLLQGTISIENMENVTDVLEAKDANLMHKQYLDELKLRWSREESSCDENLETDVLDELRPHTNLPVLEIMFYGGTKFPSWMGDPSFSKMVKIRLEGCTKCTSLPPLGQLPRLKVVHIEGMRSVKRVGAEFYGDGCPFPSLEILRFENMLEWVEWSCCLTEDAAAAGQFHHLRELSIDRCPKLLMVPLLMLPSLQELRLQSCDKVILKSFRDLISLTYLEIASINGLCHLDEEVLPLSTMTVLEKLVVSDCIELVTLWQNLLVRLRSLVVSNCPRLVSLRGEEQGLPSNLESLHIRECDNLEKLPKSMMSSLRQLKIFVVSKSGNGLGLGELRDLSLLRGTISIQGLQNVTDVLEASNANLMHKQYLDELELRWSPEESSRDENLETDVLDELRPHTNLPVLKIMFYGGTKFPSWMGDPSFSNMVKIRLEGCTKCKSLPSLGQLPMLKVVHIEGMPSVKSVGVEFYGDGCPFPSLESLTFYDMPEWVEWSCCLMNDATTAGQFRHLRVLTIRECPKLLMVPLFKLPSLQSLESLTFYDMPEWVEWSCCLTEVAAAAGQFHHLRELTIRECPKLLMVPLLRLSSLQKLTLKSCDKVILKSFGDLTSLTYLEIKNINGLCHLDEEVLPLSTMTALEELLVSNCSELVTLWQNSNNNNYNNGGGIMVQSLLVRLRSLDVLGCPRLVSLANTNMLATLSKLTIYNCPLLKQRCLNKKGDYWSSIVYIPYMRIDFGRIDEQSS